MFEACDKTKSRVNKRRVSDSKTHAPFHRVASPFPTMRASRAGAKPRIARAGARARPGASPEDPLNDMSSTDDAQHANDAPFTTEPPAEERALSPSDASGGPGEKLAEDATAETRTARPTLRGDASASSLLAGASTGSREHEREDGSKDYWRRLRSRAVMRQLAVMAKVSSRSLRLTELEQARGSETGVEEKESEESVETTARKGKRPGDPPDASASRGGPSSASRHSEPPEDLDELEDKLSAWLQCSGLHTVDKWVLNYRKHPSCWAALLMMHGVPEVSGRLRAKVENYAIYSALFLSCTIQAVMSPPDAMQCADREFDTEAASVQCQVARRVAVYALLAAIVMHFYSIILAMAFVNALNETAREADVFRMFARGQGYLATFKCQQAFRRGAAFVMLAIAAVSLEYIGWDAVVWIAALLAYVLRNFAKTSNLLFSTGSLVHYWREELGGKPDADDPYEIAPAVHVFKERVKFSRGVLGDEDPVDEDALGGKADGKLWRGAGEDRTRPGGGAAKTWSTASFVNPSAWSFGSSGSQGTHSERSGEPHRGEPHRDAAARDTEGALSAADDDRGAGSAGDPTDSSRRDFDSAAPTNLIKHHAAKKKLAKERDAKRRAYNDQHLGTHVGSKAAAIL